MAEWKTIEGSGYRVRTASGPGGTFAVLTPELADSTCPTIVDRVLPSGGSEMMCEVKGRGQIELRKHANLILEALAGYRREDEHIGRRVEA